MVESRHAHFLPRNGQGGIGRLLASLKIFSVVKRLPATSAPSNAPVGMLAIKGCTQQISDLSEHTVRQLVLQNKLRRIQTGQGQRGKILVPKSALLDYLRMAA